MPCLSIGCVSLVTNLRKNRIKSLNRFNYYLRSLANILHPAEIVLKKVPFCLNSPLRIFQWFLCVPQPFFGQGGLFLKLLGGISVFLFSWVRFTLGKFFLTFTTIFSSVKHLNKISSTFSWSYLSKISTFFLTLTPLTGWFSSAPLQGYFQCSEANCLTF